ncbi:MAG: hypothetical protein EAZ84_11615 [Verrucomicrobia bacterium]|nr:MAG: hypothetical protein EAZ84_11615 [Verrucomicrobiota bacterium]TAE88713.1 MAG: hypothetical protein EAZ82_03160 [Verrucomicrobiota bacterium]TAF26515.1 MAG: hypothetical protein EAZ71_04685 [Verrucomicrobiota bacterium]
MKSPRSISRRGYTLVELSLAMATGMVLAVMLLALVNQQIAFLRILNAQSFLTTEVPVINNYLTRVIGSAEGYRLYRSVEDLVAGDAPVFEDAPVVLLRFKEPDGTFRASVLSFEDPGSGRGLYYRMVNREGVLGSADWSLTTKPANVRFAVEQGILRARITGPNGEEIFYSGTQQL